MSAYAEDPASRASPDGREAPPRVHPIRFGEKAIELRLLTADQVEEALSAQEAGRRCGLDRAIGAWLHDQGYLDLVQVQAIMAATGDPGRGRLLPDVELMALLGRGTSGAVYRGRLLPAGEDVAVKVRAPRREMDDPDAARFKLEGQLGERLRHPAIVRVYRAGRTRDFLYHVIEYVDGLGLDLILRADGPIAEGIAIDLAIQLCGALECAAAAGVVHRDVKPANVLVTRQGQAKLCDLGLAKDLAKGTCLTADGILLGSPYYIAPEYAQTGDIDTRGDIYALGVTLYHVVTGAVPFPGKTAMEILRAVVQEVPLDPREHAAHLSPSFSKIILRMMARDPAARYQTPAVVREALAATGRARPGAAAALVGRILSVPDPARG